MGCEGRWVDAEVNVGGEIVRCGLPAWHCSRGTDVSIVACQEDDDRLASTGKQALAKRC